ncbi:hypothetical protein I4U23_024031 [Adineta vaga]|nr:hypothetical protein I4U23_024031 [Adineta vaga]
MSIVSDKYIAYFPKLSVTAQEKFTSTRVQNKQIPAVRFFFNCYKAFPCLLTCKQDANELFHISSILNYLQTEFQHNLMNDIVSQKFHIKSKQFYVTTRLSDLGNGIMVFVNNAHLVSDVDNPNNYHPDLSDDSFVVSKQITIYYLPDLDSQVQNIGKEFMKRSVCTSKLLKLHLIGSSPLTGYRLIHIKIKKPLIYDLALHYGQNFVNTHKCILNELNKKDGHGIVLLHGLPGSGKTHYIRYLLDEISSKKLVYLPPDMAKDLTKPALLTFLLQHPNAILIIEDAENIIRDRTEQISNMTQAVANLLNLSDGLLGDAIHMQIIATFNCDLRVIDKALLRKGRMIANYSFGKLDVDNAKILSEKLGFGVNNITTSMTLAEIYNQNKDDENDNIA